MATRWSYPIDRLLSLRLDLYDLLCFEFLDTVLTTQRYDDLIGLLRVKLPKAIPVETLVESTRYLLGQTVRDSALQELTWRLAGNLPRLRRGKAVNSWQVQRFPEWVPLQIVAAKRHRNRRGELGCLFTFRILAGTPAGLLLHRWLSNRFCRFASRKLGFSRPPSSREQLVGNRYPYSAPEQLVAMRVLGLVTPESSQEGPMFKELDFPGSMKSYNREQLRLRFRVDPGYNCPQGFPRSSPCHRCPFGYRSCRAGTHRDDWKLASCPSCERDAYFDPELSDEVCRDCAVRRR